MNNQVTRFKMYKDGKKWIIAGLAATTLGIVSLTQTAAQADTTTAPIEVSNTLTNSSGAAVTAATTQVTSAQAQVTSASQAVITAQSSANQASSDAEVAKSAVSQASTDLAAANQRLATAQSAQNSAQTQASTNQATTANAQTATLASENNQQVTKTGVTNKTTQNDMMTAETTTYKASLPNAGTTNTTSTRYAMDGTVYYDASQTQHADSVAAAANWWNTNSGFKLFAASDSAHPATLIVTDFNNDLADILATQSYDGTLNLNNSVIDAYGYDTTTVLIHEMGHTLGILHDSASKDIMSAIVPNIRAKDVKYSAYEKATVAISQIVYKDNLVAAKDNQSLFEQYNGYTTGPTKAQYSNQNYNQWRTLRSALSSEIYAATAKASGNSQLTNALTTAKEVLSKMNVGTVDLLVINQANQSLASLYQLSGDTNPAVFVDHQLKINNPAEYQQALANQQALVQVAANAGQSVETINLAPYQQAVQNAQQAVETAENKLATVQQQLAQSTNTSDTAQHQLTNAISSQQAAKKALDQAQTQLKQAQQQVKLPVTTAENNSTTTEKAAVPAPSVAEKVQSAEAQVKSTTPVTPIVVENNATTEPTSAATAAEEKVQPAETQVKVDATVAPVTPIVVENNATTEATSTATAIEEKVKPTETQVKDIATMTPAAVENNTTTEATTTPATLVEEKAQPVQTNTTASKIVVTPATHEAVVSTPVSQSKVIDNNAEANQAPVSAPVQKSSDNNTPEVVSSTPTSSVDPITSLTTSDAKKIDLSTLDTSSDTQTINPTDSQRQQSVRSGATMKAPQMLDVQSNNEQTVTPTATTTHLAPTTSNADSATTLPQTGEAHSAGLLSILGILLASMTLAVTRRLKRS